MSDVKIARAPAPIKSQDHQWIKPDEFTLVRVGTPSGESYVISFIEHVLNPVAVEVAEGDAYGIEVERRIRVTMQIPIGFFRSLQAVAEEVEKRTQQPGLAANETQ